MGGEIRHEHLHRYAFAAAFVSGKRVLDLACGEGYGSALLAARAADVIGIDISQEAVEHARRTYGSLPKLSFAQGDATALPLSDSSVDVVVSFETIEHHAQHDEMMREFARVLRLDGILVLSSPNKAVYSDEAGFVNDFHVKELYFDELDALTRRHFRRVAYLGQRFATGSVIYPLDVTVRSGATRRVDVLTDDGEAVSPRPPQLRSPSYFLLLASNAAVLPEGDTSLLFSEPDDLYLEFKKVAKWASGIHGELESAQSAARENEASLRAQLAQARSATGSEPLVLASQLDAAERALQQRTAEDARRQAAWADRLLSAEQSLRRLDAEWRQRAQQAVAPLELRLEALQAELTEARNLYQRQEQESAAQLMARTQAHERDRAQALERLAELTVASLAAQREFQLRLEDAARRQFETDEAARLRESAFDAERTRAEQARRQLQTEAAHQQAALQRRLERQAIAARAELDQRLDDLGHERLRMEAVWRQRHVQLRLAGRRRDRESNAALADMQARFDRLRSEYDAAAARREQQWQSRDLEVAAELGAERQGHRVREDELCRSVTQLQAQLLALERERANCLADMEKRLRDVQKDAAAQREQYARDALRHARQSAILGRGLLDMASSPGWRLVEPLRRIGVSVLPHGRHSAWPELLMLAYQATIPDVPPEPPLLIRMINITKPDLGTVSTVDDILELDDLSFIRAAYVALLGRATDPEGERHFLALLLNGGSRLRVLYDIRHSAEGRARTVTLQGFEDAMRKMRVSRIPLLGRVVRTGARPPSARGLRRSVEGVATAVIETDQHMKQRLAEIEQRLQAVHADAEGKAEAMLIAQALRRYHWPADTDLWRAARQLVADDASAFVTRLFRLALKREPHGYELAYFKEQVGEGASRSMLVDKVILSPEFASLQPPPPPSAAPPLPVLSGPGQRPALPPATEAVTAVGSPWAPALPSLPIYAEPKVSVIVPIYGKLDYTLRCLKSIAANPPAVPFEVIVVDDCSPDDSAKVLAGVPGIRLESNPKNLGFIRSCNRGAALALGSHLCFLNNDTEVHPGWLDELFRSFDIFPGTGLVGSKLIYPDGTLQEAGGILWRNGNAWNFGRGQDASLPVYNYAREVDYCSGASIMLPKALFNELGGFDEHYLPAYCEDSDLALKVRDKGLRVIYQPMSVVVHHEGITSGTDTGSGTKAYQIANATKLFERWKKRLANHQPDGETPDEAKDRRHKLRVLVLEHCTPTPDQDAGSVSVFNMLLLLREMDFQVTFIAEDNFLYMPDYTVMLQRVGVEVLYAPYVTSVKQHVEQVGGRYDMVYLFRPLVVERNIKAIKANCTRARILFYTHDIHHIRMEREAALLQNPEKAAEAEKMKRAEFEAIRCVDSTIVVSTAELETLQPQLPETRLQILPLLLDVPGTDIGFEERRGLIFVGGYQHTPNIDAVQFFVNEVMPLLRERLPGVALNLVGSKPPPAVLALAAPDVVVHGFVEHLTPLLNCMRVSVAPLRYGAGVKGKVGTALASGLPTVATSIAAEGMSMVAGEHLLVADSPVDFAEAVVRAYTDINLWHKLSENGIKYARQSWGSAASFEAFAEVIRNLGLIVPVARYPLSMYTSEKFSCVVEKAAPNRGAKK